MHRRHPAFAALSALVALCVLSTTLAPAHAAAPAADTAPPRVLHAVVTKAHMGQNIDVKVQFQDQSEIFEPKLYFRRVGELEYNAIELGPSGVKGEWVGVVPATFVTRDLEYFVEAFDIMGNGPGRNGSPEKPHVIRVATRAEPTEPRQIQTVAATPVQPLAAQNVTATRPTFEEPVYKKWWFWTIIVVGVGAVAGGTAAAVICAQGKCGGGPAPAPSQVTIQVNGPDPRTGLPAQ